MNRKIRITNDKHFYLDEVDISAFVADYSIESDERVVVTLHGEVIPPVKPKPKRKGTKKVVKDGDG